MGWMPSEGSGQLLALVGVGGGVGVVREAGAPVKQSCPHFHWLKIRKKSPHNSKNWYDPQAPVYWGWGWGWGGGTPPFSRGQSVPFQLLFFFFF